MRWVTANDLETWARTLNSRVDLPKVVSDLIRASVPDIATMRFPSGDKGQVRGFDGHLVCGLSGFNVPDGESYWEFGTDEDYKPKSRRDFNKRTREVSAAEQANITFIFVSPWTWDSSKSTNKLEDWIKTSKAASSWKDVRYIDGAALANWLDQCPAVAAWHARETFRVRPLEGVRSTEEFWRDFAGQFGPELTEEVVLCGREDVTGQLLTELMQSSNTVQVVADSPDEAVAFAVAAMRKADPAVRLYLEARTLIVDSLAAGRQLLSADKLVLLLRNEAARSPGQLAAIGPLLVPLGRKQSSGAAFVLDRPGGQAMGMAMRTMGLEENQALTYARGSGRSLRALARLIPGGASEDPPWVGQGPSLLPAILAGAWDSKNDLDRSVVERVAAGEAYLQLEGRVRQFRDEADPPFDLEGSVWKVRAPMDAFVRIGRLIDDGQVDRLKSVMIDVFSAIEPDADPDAVIQFSRPNPTGHSDWLRDGLATTFLLIAVWGQTAKVSLSGQTGQEWANKLLEELPGLSSDPRVIASLKNQLPLLAEAAPDPLLVALERMLEGNGELILPIFDEKPGFLSPNYSHTGLLWALETVAWDPDYFRRAVLVLAGLAAIAPEIRLVNTPANSLGEIFVLWSPHTNASWPARLSALREICDRHPSVGWSLVMRLMPTMHGSSSPTAKPKLREGGASDRPRMTYRELWEHQAEVITIAIGLAGEDDDRWRELIPKLGMFPPREREVALARLDETMRQATPERQRRLWERLRDEVVRHERFQNAKWALKGDDLAPLQALASKYAPTDPVTAIIVLFGAYALDETGDLSVGTRRRAEALRKLYDDHGADAVLRLAAEARVPYLVVEAARGAGFTEDQIEQLLTLSFKEDPGSQLTVGLSGVYRWIAGEEKAVAWLTRGDAEMSPDTLSDLLQPWPDGLSTWNIVRRLGSPVVAAYWKRRAPRYLEGSKRELLQATLMYLRFGRAIEAIQSSLNRLPEIPTELIFRMLEGVIPELNENGARADTMTAFYVEKAMEALDHRGDAPIEKVSGLEFAFFPLFEYAGHRHLQIHRLMAAQPGAYHHILRHVFRGDHEDVGEPTEDARSRARRSYSILMGFSDIPGLGPEGLDGHALSAWIDEVRRLGIEHDRPAVTENFIGRLLAHAPPDPDDGGWPHKAVRQEIERVQSDELERGLQLERFNMRGAHGKELYEGGEQERALAAQNAQWAEISSSWPRTAALLRAIAKGWQEDAEREDIEAAQRKLRS